MKQPSITPQSCCEFCGAKASRSWTKRFSSRLERCRGYFIDAKEALCAGADLRIAAQAITERIATAGIPFDAVGGLTLGADALAAAIAVVSGADWFIVRKEPKNRGTNRLVEGKQIASGDQVLLVDDVVTTGSSMLRAFDAVVDTGAQVVAAVTLVDRGDRARQDLEARSVPYFPMTTYVELGIPPSALDQASLQRPAERGLTAFPPDPTRGRQRNCETPSPSRRLTAAPQARSGSHPWA